MVRLILSLSEVQSTLSLPLILKSTLTVSFRSCQSPHLKDHEQKKKKKKRKNGPKTTKPQLKKCKTWRQKWSLSWKSIRQSEFYFVFYFVQDYSIKHKFRKAAINWKLLHVFKVNIILIGFNRVLLSLKKGRIFF